MGVAVLVMVAAIGALIALTVASERYIRVLRSEVNMCKAQEQLLLNRLAARNLGELKAFEQPIAPPSQPKRWLYDDTGLVRVEADDE